MSEEVTAPVSNETVSETTEQVEQAEPVAKRYKVKVDGNEVDVDEAELIRGYAHRQAADKRFQESAQMRKQAEEFINLLRTDPVKVFSNKQLGVDFRKVAEEYLVSQLEEETLDPKERELRSYKKQVEEYERQKREIEEQEEARRAEEIQRHYTEDYSNKIAKALETSGLPRTEHTIKRMAYYMHQGLQRGYDLSPSDITDLVRQDYISEQKALFGALDGDVLLQFLGDETANKIRKHDVSRLKKVQPRTSERAPASQASKPQKKLSKEEWRAKLYRDIE